MARVVARTLRQHDIDYWLDENDTLLTVANRTGNHAEVVRRIEDGISESTHVLAIISQNTKESWWVSYEIGSGRRKGAEVAYIPRDDVTSLPSYLQIAYQIRTDVGYLEWVRVKFGRYNTRSYSLELEDVYIPGIPRLARATIPFYDQG